MPRARNSEELCPCRTCGGRVWRSLQTIKAHMRNDIDQDALENSRSAKRRKINHVERPNSPTSLSSSGATRPDDPHQHLESSSYNTSMPLHAEDDTELGLENDVLGDSGFQDVFKEHPEPGSASSGQIPHQPNDDDLLLDSDDDTIPDLRSQPNRLEAAGGPHLSDIETIDAAADPLFRTREAIFDDEAWNSHCDSDTTLPPAFEEDPILRNIYIRTFAQAAFKGATHDAVHDILHSEQTTMIALQERGLLDESLELSQMATTLRTVERRLGVSPDDHIIYYFLCPECWYRYHPSQLRHLVSPECSVNGCVGILYTSNGVKDSTGREKRTPTKILPYAPLKNYVRRMLLRPGKAEEVEHWRRDGDFGDKPPISTEEWSDQTGMDDLLCDIHDGSAWRSIQDGVKRVLDRNSREAYDIDESGSDREGLRFVSRYLGLMFTLNIDWFQPLAGRVHSTGALYVTINNLPRHIRYLRSNTFLLCVIPGPHEPSKEQLNVVLELFVDELREFAAGISMPVAKSMVKDVSDDNIVDATAETGSQSGKDQSRTLKYECENKVVSGTGFINCSDTPARAKASGLASVSCEDHFCPICEAKLASITSPSCFNPTNFQYREPCKQLFWKLIAKDAGQNRRDQIASIKGVRYSPLDDITNWYAAWSSPIDPMHCILIGITAHVHKVILFNGGMFNNSRKKGAPQPALLFEEFMGSIWWPGWVARTPSKIGKGNGKVKADQWRNLHAVYAVALFVAWRNQDDKIPDEDAPKAPKTQLTSKASEKSNILVKKRRVKNLINETATDAEVDEDELAEAENQKASRNYAAHYRPILDFLAGSRITLSQTITRREAKRAQDFLAIAFREWARLGCHLTPNFHLALHIYDFIELYGPVYGWWVYAFERMNGILGRFNTNGHSGGELEGTMLRGWIKTLQLQELVSMMQNLDNKTRDDTVTIDLLLQAMKGGAEHERARGTFLHYLSSITPHRSPDAVELPAQSQVLDLIATSLYDLVLGFVRCHIDQNVFASSQRAPANSQHRKLTRLRITATSYSTLHFGGLKYGSDMHHRGKKFSYGYVNGRQAARINHLFTIYLDEISGATDQAASFHCAVIERFAEEVKHQAPPWHTHATDLGIHIWSNCFRSPEVIMVSQLSGHFAWAPIKIGNRDLLVTFSMDHRTQEPDKDD